MKIVIAVVVIGHKCQQEYKDLFFNSHKRYCAKYGYRLCVITEFIDKSEVDISLVSFQKILVPSIDTIRNADLVAIVDYDIVINVEAAPPLGTLLKDDKMVGVVDEASQPTYEKRIALNINNGWKRDAGEYYRSCGFDFDTNIMVNSGFLVMNPMLYCEFFTEVYKFGKLNGRNHPYGFLYEQALVGFSLQSNHLCEVLDNKWNAIFKLGLLDANVKDPFFVRRFLVNFYQNNYLIHFAGRGHHLIESLVGALSDGYVITKGVRKFQ
jgi:hypothetical protein